MTMRKTLHSLALRTLRPRCARSMFGIGLLLLACYTSVGESQTWGPAKAKPAEQPAPAEVIAESPAEKPAEALISKWTTPADTPESASEPLFQPPAAVEKGKAAELLPPPRRDA